MIRLVGYVNGGEISFDFSPPNTFKATIPKNLTGTYVLLLKAVDGAGNESTISDIYVLIDFKNLYFKVLNDACDFKTLDSGFSFEEVGTDYFYEELILL